MNRYEIYGYKMYSKIMQQNAHLKVTDTEPGSSNSFKWKYNTSQTLFLFYFFYFIQKRLIYFDNFLAYCSGPSCGYSVHSQKVILKGRYLWEKISCQLIDSGIKDKHRFSSPKP